MTALVWDKTGEKFFETGVEKGVYYPVGTGNYEGGVAWNGLTGVTESPSGAEPTALWADNIKYLNLISAEQFAATVEAYTYPPEFAEANGEKEIVKGARIGQQTRSMFGMSYVTRKGNDVKGTDLGYLIHLIYGATAAPSEKSYSSINESPEAMTLSWELSTTPVEVTGGKPTATVVIDSTTADPTKLKELEKILWGDELTEPRLPLPNEIATLLNAE